jgi:hypothetical protein
MREDKPSWTDVPTDLVRDLEDLLRSRIVDATTVWGGYGPTATFVVRMQNGRSYFCKGTHPGHTPEGEAAVRREAAIYEALPELRAFAPGFHGSVRTGAWHLLVLDYVEPVLRVPPWTDDSFQRVIAALARFHASVPPRARSVLESLDSPPPVNLIETPLGWRELSLNPSKRSNFFALFADKTGAEMWFDDHIAKFVELESQAARLGGPSAWVHQDIRSDNILFETAHRPLLVDWPYLAYGPVLLDVAFFLPSVCGEGGPFPAAGLALYETEFGSRVDERDVQIAVATVAGFFAARAGEPEIPALPRLRWVQRLQLFPSLAWLSQVMSDGPPPSQQSTDKR